MLFFHGINPLTSVVNVPPSFSYSCLQMETASLSNGTRYYVMAVTPTRLYSFTGFGSLDVSLALLSFSFGSLHLRSLNTLTDFIPCLECIC